MSESLPSLRENANQKISNSLIPYGGAFYFYQGSGSPPRI